MRRLPLIFLLALAGLKAGPAIPLPIDQVLTPDGAQTALPQVRPNVIALSPNGRTLVTSGVTGELFVLEPETGAILQRVPLPPGAMADAKAQASFTGLAFAPDGRRLYLSDMDGTIKVFAVAAGAVTGQASWPLPPANAPRRIEEIPAGLAVSPDGRRLYIAGNLSNTLLELDTATGQILRRIDVGVEPYDVVLVGATAYVSNWGGRRPAATDLVGPAGHGTHVRVDPIRFIASEGSVTLVDLRKGQARAELVTGRHASGLARSRNGRYVAVANAGEDTVSVIDSRSDRIVETISLRWHPGDFFGASPNALAFGRDGRLFVCNGTQNSVAVVAFRPGESRLDGLIPVGWYPAAIACSEKSRLLYIANLKGEGQLLPRDGHPGGFNSHQFIGSVSLVPLPTTDRLRVLTRQVLANYGQGLMAEARRPARKGQAPRPVPERVGEPSVFKHVIYIIKENRTYDQVLGDIKEGNGDPSLCIFGEPVTPNLHKLVREFALLDNTYCAGILSADGHQWATSAFVTDYIEKAFSGFPRSYVYGGFTEGVDAMAYAPSGFIWDLAAAQGRSFRNYGEFMLPRVQWTDPHRGDVPGWADIHRELVSPAGAIAFGCTPGIPSLAAWSKFDTVGWNLNVPDQYRVDRFLEEFRRFAATGQLPALIVLYLPSDHAQGTIVGVPTPAAYLADNDLAMGRVVEAISHSAFWADTCLFAIEDDPQNGWDHVSGYRTTAYVASAYTKRHAVVSERYTQPGLMRTIELILGLPPMNQMDATATPWNACFTTNPDLTPFVSVPNRVPLDQLNPALADIHDRTLRRDALASARLPFAEPDKCPEDVLNRILWHAQKGSRAPYPQWAILAHPEDDDD